MKFAFYISALCLSLTVGCCNTVKTSEQEPDNIYQFSAVDNSGQQVALSEYKGKVLLVVNTASRCGFTPQYDGLENLYSKFRDKGFVILDFPCNQFGAQAPESDSAYAAFCKINYHVDFPQFHKVEVNGDNEHPLYHWLKTQNVSDSTANTDIKWNFTKFLVDRSGSVVKRFEPGVTIEELTPEVERVLAGQ